MLFDDLFIRNERVGGGVSRPNDWRRALDSILAAAAAFGGVSHQKAPFCTRNCVFVALHVAFLARDVVSVSTSRSRDGLET